MSSVVPHPFLQQMRIFFSLGKFSLFKVFGRFFDGTSSGEMENPSGESGVATCVSLQEVRVNARLWANLVCCELAW